MSTVSLSHQAMGALKERASQTVMALIEGNVALRICCERALNDEDIKGGAGEELLESFKSIAAQTDAIDRTIVDLGKAIGKKEEQIKELSNSKYKTLANESTDSLVSKINAKKK